VEAAVQLIILWMIYIDKPGVRSNQIMCLPLLT
jgi:hypothetical protein